MVCCVFGCTNSHTTSACEFYKFPKHKHKEDQKKLWIAAVQRNHPDGSNWILKPSHVICSQHFIGNRKSDSVLSPSYVPTVFSLKHRNKIDEKQALSRHARFMKRRMADQSNELNVEKPRRQLKQQKERINGYENGNQQNEIINYGENSAFDRSVIVGKENVDQECQVEILHLNDFNTSNSFTCVKYIYSDKNYCDAEIQTDLTSLNTIEIVGKKVKYQCVGTPSKSACDEEVSCNLEKENRKFCGYESIINEKQLKQTAGVTKENFEFLLKRAKSAVNENRCTVSLKNRLFIFLILMKTGLTFSTLSVFFAVNETTISKIFYSMLHHLAAVTANLVFWPDKYVVQRTMPDCFKPEYANTRVIIDCTEFKIEIPSGVNNKVFTYSHYKKGFTAKVLIGIAPCGWISFKSKVAGGRKTDSNITIESKCVDLLEDGDEVLADKGFPEIKAKIDASGKKVLFVMPPFLEKKNEFSEKETSLTYSVARVRIHVERIMQRLRTYKILQFIPEHLFSSIDDLLQMCCVLVNLQTPIIAGINIE
ncbi:uncharacterized protein LOC124404708 [Diprion similis]|uniref:uncharacterized protein LOC124404708 n=1 Tax=Diprion similis TaxID=362088 RepID=UPI001EF7675B|nr:uncharacterized protein LOC124404708 [Diprion similis]